MRDCIFLLADRNMEAAFDGFFSREGYHYSLGCDPFDWDILVAAGDNDPGLYTRGHELLRPFQATHHRAIVVLDAAWEGAPDAVQIKQDMTERIQSTGWEPDTFQVIVIDPELENWIWQRNEHVAQGLGFANRQGLLEDEAVQAKWPTGQDKPAEPKELLEDVLRKKRIPRSSAIYKNITSRVSISGCTDDAFLEMHVALLDWFPIGGE